MFLNIGTLDNLPWILNSEQKNLSYWGTVSFIIPRTFGGIFHEGGRGGTGGGVSNVCGKFHQKYEDNKWNLPYTE